jgi:hypothetical protein
MDASSLKESFENSFSLKPDSVTQQTKIKASNSKKLFHIFFSIFSCYSIEHVAVCGTRQKHKYNLPTKILGNIFL